MGWAEFLVASGQFLLITGGAGVPESGWRSARLVTGEFREPTGGGAKRFWRFACGLGDVFVGGYAKEREE